MTNSPLFMLHNPIAINAWLFYSFYLPPPPSLLFLVGLTQAATARDIAYTTVAGNFFLVVSASSVGLFLG